MFFELKTTLLDCVHDVLDYSFREGKEEEGKLFEIDFSFIMKVFSHLNITVEMNTDFFLLLSWLDMDSALTRERDHLSSHSSRE